MSKSKYGDLRWFRQVLIPIDTAHDPDTPPLEERLGEAPAVPEPVPEAGEVLAMVPVNPQPEHSDRASAERWLRDAGAAGTYQLVRMVRHVRATLPPPPVLELEDVKPPPSDDDIQL